MNFLRRFKQRAASETAPAAVAALAPAPPPPIDFQKLMGRDQVTGLPNRPCFTHLVAEHSVMASKMETRLSVIVVGWEGYHGIADKVERDRRLAAMAGQLRGALNRAHDLLGSLGEGRFGVLLPFTDGPGAETVARNLLEMLGEAQVPQAKEPADPDYEEEVPGDLAPAVPPSIRVGLTSYNGKGPLAADALLASAEQAVSFAGLNGSGRVVRFELNGARPA